MRSSAEQQDPRRLPGSNLRVFWYLLTFLSLICGVTESNLAASAAAAAAASTFHFIDCPWLHKAVIKAPHLPHSAFQSDAGPQNGNEPVGLEAEVMQLFSVICIFSAAAV